MENKGILKGGLSIISQCKKETNDIWHAHFGAAAIASYFNHIKRAPNYKDITLEKFRYVIHS
ncbi:hypothetical protein P9X08_32035 [Bacillus cereus]|nr:hypothetical protein [Bacillus cereus]